MEDGAMGVEVPEELYGSQSDLAYSRLRQAIASGRYQPGERVTESTVAGELGISRTPVREAMRRLQSDGLVVSSGRGVLIPRLRPAEVAQLYQLRAALEALTAELAAERVGDGAVAMVELELLRRRAAEFERASETDDLPSMVRANLALHQAIAELGANAFARDALHRIWDNVAFSSVTNLGDHAWVARVRDQHRALVGAIVSGDANEARSVARTHVTDAGAVYIERARAREAR